MANITGRIGAAAAALMLLGGVAQAQFPRDSTGHLYVEADVPGADSAAAEAMVSIWKTRAEDGSFTFACVYGKPEKTDSGVIALRVTKVERAGTLGSENGLSVPECRSDSIGFLVFGSGIYNAARAETAIAGILAIKKDWILGAVVYGIAPVPPKDAAQMRIPLWVPRLFAVIYSKPRNGPGGIKDI